MRRFAGWDRSKARKLARAALVVTVLTTGACGLRSCHLLETPVALCTAKSGTVTVSDPDVQRDLLQDDGVFNEQVVATGDDGRATLTFTSGERIDLEPNTSVVVRHGGSAGAEFGAVLVSGNVRASSKGNTVGFEIGTPFGVVSLGGDAAELQVGSEAGLAVLVGTVTITGDDGTQKTLDAGQTLSVAGVVVDLTKQDTVTLEPMTFVLISNPKQVKVKRVDDKTWRRPNKQETLATGDAVRTGHADHTQVRFDEHTQLDLGPDTEVAFGDVMQGKGTQKAAYALKSGEVNIAMQRSGDGAFQHDLEVGQNKVRIEPGVDRADVQVRTDKKGASELVVRLGRAILPDGTVVSAGRKVDLAADASHDSVVPMAATSVDLAPASSAVIYYSGGSLPPVAFTWKSAEGEPAQRFELSRDKDFKKLVFAEDVPGGRLVYDALTSGRFYWRVRQGDDWQRGTYSVERKDPSSDCPGCKRTNIIDNTGEQTVVYFQKRLPSIVLRWEAEKDAARFRLKVFADGALDTPMFDEEIQDTKHAFGSGRFGEGRYFWLVSPIDAAGKQLRQGRMNTLEIAYDNAVVDLAIRTPNAGEKVSGANVVVRGEVALGTKVQLDGKRVDVDRQGRFRERVSLTKGRNDLVFRTLGADGIARYYVHPVVRR